MVDFVPPNGQIKQGLRQDLEALTIKKLTDQSYKKHSISSQLSYKLTLLQAISVQADSVASFISCKRTLQNESLAS